MLPNVSQEATPAETAGRCGDAARFPSDGAVLRGGNSWLGCGHRRLSSRLLCRHMLGGGKEIGMELREKLDSLLDAVELLLSNKLHGPSLILIYSTIDVLAWLGRHETHPDVTRKDFITWAQTYLLPLPESKITATNLYSARCSVLHSYSVESRLSREQEAVEIFYAWGSATSSDLQRIIDSTGRNAIALQTENLVEALRRGIDKFLSEFPDIQLLSSRNEKLLANVPI
jgi:hypothetical protein